jgi:hypothetical protein
MGDGIYVDGTQRGAMRRARVYAGQGYLGQARTEVRKVLPDGSVESLGGFVLGADGQVLEVS